MKRKRIEESSKKPPLKRQNATVTNATIVRSPIASNIDVNDYNLAEREHLPFIDGLGGTADSALSYWCRTTFLDK